MQPAAQPPAAQPPAAQPPAAQPHAAQPPAAQPLAVQAYSPEAAAARMKNALLKRKDEKQAENEENQPAAAPQKPAKKAKAKPKAAPKAAPKAPAPGNARKPPAAKGKARPPPMQEGDPTVLYLGGKLHRNSGCFRSFAKATDRCDRKYPFKNRSEEEAWALACQYIEENQWSRCLRDVRMQKVVRSLSCAIDHVYLKAVHVHACWHATADLCAYVV